MLVSVAASPGSTAPAQATTAAPSGFSEQPVFTGLDHPTNVAFAADSRVFVAEKSGLIKVFDSLDDPTPSVFADLRTEVHNYWDRGLLGLALHPNFPADPRVYVLYTYDAPIGGKAPKWGTPGAASDPCPTPPGPTSDGCVVSARLSVLTRTGSTVAEQVLIEDWCQQFPSHSIGTVAFGPDGMLYAGGGDGSHFNYADYGQDGYTTSDVTPDNPCGDPPSPVGTALKPPSAEGGSLRSQDVRTTADPAGLDGSLIRINPDTGAAAPGNPMLSSTDPNTRRIVAYGLRNPLRFAFRPGTSEIWIGDVGWKTWEEIDRIASPTAARTNFGWPCYEGAGRQGGYDGADLSLCESLYAAGPSAVAAPYYTYNHSAKVVAGEACGTGSSSVSGMAFYAQGNYPASYDGALFFADYSRKCIWAMQRGGGADPNPANIVTFATGVGTVALQPGPGGDIFAADYDGGRIVRYVYNGTNNPPTAMISTDKTSGLAPLTVNFDGTGSNDADGDPLTYAWDLNGDGVYDDSTAPTAQRTYTANGDVTVRLRVSDNHGGIGTADVTIHVGNTPPTATITSPSPGLTWKVGDRIAFSGSATDSEDGVLPASALSWSLIMHHCPSNCHTHVITTMDGASGSFVAPDHEYPSYLELQLTATDAGGLTDVKSVRLDPVSTKLSFATNPAGFAVTYLQSSVPTPSSAQAIAGSAGSLSSVMFQVRDQLLYRFASWSDGGARTHNITTPMTPTTFTATYIPKRNLAQNRALAVSATSTLVDLGVVQNFNRVLLNWSTTYPTAYRIELSSNRTTWTTVFSTTTSDGGIDVATFTAASARYVRVAGITASTAPKQLSVFADAGIITGMAGRCVDVTGNRSADLTPIELWNCVSLAPNQRWTQYEDGTVRSLGKCLDARSTAKANGTPIVLYRCDGTSGQRWQARPDGSLVNIASTRCLNAAGASTALGTRLILYTCVSTARNDKWVLP